MLTQTHTTSAPREAGENERTAIVLRAIIATLSQPVQSTDLTNAFHDRLQAAASILRSDAAVAVKLAQQELARIATR